MVGLREFRVHLTRWFVTVGLGRRIVLGFESRLEAGRNSLRVRSFPHLKRTTNVLVYYCRFR